MSHTALKLLSASDPRRANALLLVGIALFLAWASLTGRVSRCVAPEYAWLTPLGALFVAAMGVAALRSLPGHHHGPHDEHEHDEHGHACPTCAHGQRLWLNRAIMALPFALALAVDPVRLSPEGVRKRRAPRTSAASLSKRAREARLEAAFDWILGGAPAAAEPGADRARGAADEDADIDLANATVKDVLDWALAGKSRALDGKFVSLIGQAAPCESGEPGRFYLVRLVVVCCIADARGVDIEVAAPPGAATESMVWVKASGVLRFQQGDLSPAPVLHAATVERVPEPGQPYL